MRGTKYLSEILNPDDIWNSDTYSFIIAGTGGGKSTFAKELVKKANKALYLVDTNKLETAMKAELRGLNNVEVITYKSFGMKFNTLNDDDSKHLKEYDLIIGDEIHQLARYYEKYNNDVDYFYAMELLLRKDTGIQKIIMTATPYYFDMFTKKFKANMMINYKEYPVYKDPELIQYEVIYTDYFHHYKQLEDILKYNIGARNLATSKFLIYTPKVGTMKYLYEVCERVGLRPMMLWSENKKEEPLSHEQLLFQKHLLVGDLVTGEGRGYYKDDINCLIINDSGESGINIYDDVQYVIIDSNNPTTRAQIRGRVRHDIVMLSLKSNGSNYEPVKSLEIDDKWLNIPLTTDMKKELVQELQLTDDRGRDMKWTGLKNMLEESGYKVKDTERKIEGKRARVSIITKNQY